MLHKTGMPTTTPKPPTLPKLPPIIPLGAIGPIVDVDRAAARASGSTSGPTNPLEVGAEGRRVLERAAHPPSVFGAEWAALEAEARRPEPLARTLEVATYLSLARRVVGPAAAAGVRGLEDVLSRIDAVIRTERQRLPVKDVPEPTQLTPVIQRLRVRSRGRASDALQAWVEDLRRELNAAELRGPGGRLTVPIDFAGIAARFGDQLAEQTHSWPFLFDRFEDAVKKLVEQSEKAERATRGYPIFRYRDGALAVHVDPLGAELLPVGERAARVRRGPAGRGPALPRRHRLDADGGRAGARAPAHARRRRRARSNVRDRVDRPLPPAGRGDVRRSRAEAVRRLRPARARLQQPARRRAAGAADRRREGGRRPVSRVPGARAALAVDGPEARSTPSSTRSRRSASSCSRRSCCCPCSARRSRC